MATQVVGQTDTIGAAGQLDPAFAATVCGATRARASDGVVVHAGAGAPTRLCHWWLRHSLQFVEVVGHQWK